MKLYEVPRRTHVRIPGTDETYFFERIDGMYSLCRNQTGQVVHLIATLEVEIVDPVLERLKARGYTEEDLEASNPYNQGVSL